MHLHTKPRGDAHKHSLALIDFSLPGFPPISSWGCAAWFVNFDVLFLHKDRTGKNKGSFNAVFTANNAEKNSCRRWKGRGLMTGTKEAGHSCCVNLPWSQKKYIMHNGACVIPLLQEKKQLKNQKSFSTFTKRFAWLILTIRKSSKVTFLIYIQYECLGLLGEMW